jgi:hypothetical protein
MRAHATALITLRKKLRNNTKLKRKALLGGLSAVCWLLLGRRVLYISMMNDAMIEENNVFCEVIVSDAM